MATPLTKWIHCTIHKVNTFFPKGTANDTCRLRQQCLYGTVDFPIDSVNSAIKGTVNTKKA